MLGRARRPPPPPGVGREVGRLSSYWPRPDQTHGPHSAGMRHRSSRNLNSRFRHSQQAAQSGFVSLLTSDMSSQLLQFAFEHYTEKRQALGSPGFVHGALALGLCRLLVGRQAGGRTAVLLTCPTHSAGNALFFLGKWDYPNLDFLFARLFQLMLPPSCTQGISKLTCK